MAYKKLYSLALQTYSYVRHGEYLMALHSCREMLMLLEEQIKEEEKKDNA